MSDPVNAARINEARANGAAEQMADLAAKYEMDERISAAARKRTVMITGQQAECTQERFDKYYKPAITAAFEEGCAFVMGAAEQGCDAMAAVLLQELGAKDVVVYDKGEKDGRGAMAKGWTLANRFETYPIRDDVMIGAADCMIVYLFENAITSGTWRNVMAFRARRVSEDCRALEDPRILCETFANGSLAIARDCVREAPHAQEGWRYETFKSILYAPLK
jgi:hypothetical protein